MHYCRGSKHDDNIVILKLYTRWFRVAGNINTPCSSGSLSISPKGEVSSADWQRGRTRTCIAGGIIVRSISIISPSFGKWGDLPWRIRWARSAMPVWGTRHTCTNRRGPLFCRAETCWRQTRCTATSTSTIMIWRYIPIRRNLYWCNACQAAWVRKTIWSARVIRDIIVYRTYSILLNYWCPSNHVLNNKTER